ncbi:glycosyltransferase [Paenibacillus sp. S-38]|uniref:glycosyltransferase n=1 Tax=Paenibacillus sp. S-38 TaxID=3416710 RepID=UPI003CF35E32
MQPMVSIVIPTYNCPYVDQAIESALNQTYRSIEVIVINDGSTKHEEKIKPYFGRIKYMKKSNGGTASALNAGIRMARGDYFAWLSSDDLFLPDKIEKQLAFMRRQRASVCYTNYHTIDPAGQMIAERAGVHFDTSAAFYRHFLQGCTINGCTVMMEMKVFAEVGRFDERYRYAQDFDLWLRTVPHYDFHFLNEPLTLYRVHEGMGTLQHGGEQMREGEALIDRHRAAIERLIRDGRRAEVKEVRCSMEESFSKAYQENLWGDEESLSGTGSNLVQTETIRRLLPPLFQMYDVKTILDAPCGDFHWMRHTNLSRLDHYYGIDIVPELIQRNNQLHTHPQRTFMHLDMTKDPLPRADLILCRDCLVHLSFEDIRRAIRNFKRSGAKYLLTTTFTGPRVNTDFESGYHWRALNLEGAPFHLPSPEILINERCTEADYQYTDKSLGLWELSRLSL